MNLAHHIASLDSHYRVFGTLTLDPVKIRPQLDRWAQGSNESLRTPSDLDKMWWAFVRKACRLEGSSWRRSCWILRRERGGRTNRAHLHCLGEWWLTSEALSECWPWGRTVWSPYDPDGDAVSYCLKCLGYDVGPDVGREITRFAGDWAGVTLSEGAIKLRRAQLYRAGLIGNHGDSGTRTTRTA